ncbi:MAG: hypothetical protein WCE54_12510 [Ignavibacteriaceae bacterium]
MEEKILYKDNLVEIREDSFTLKNYYFPFGSKKVLSKDIENIEVKEPTLINGRWRIWGTGNLLYWFPLDFLRPSRKKIFFVTYKNQRIKSGFTVVDPEKVEKIFKKKEWLSGLFS